MLLSQSFVGNFCNFAAFFNFSNRISFYFNEFPSSWVGIIRTFISNFRARRDKCIAYRFSPVKLDEKDPVSRETTHPALLRATFSRSRVLYGIRAKALRRKLFNPLKNCSGRRKQQNLFSE